jgi:hypothetical protein
VTESDRQYRVGEVPAVPTVGPGLLAPEEAIAVVHHRKVEIVGLRLGELAQAHEDDEQPSRRRDRRPRDRGGQLTGGGLKAAAEACARSSARRRPRRRRLLWCRSPARGPARAPSCHCRSSRGPLFFTVVLRNQSFSLNASAKCNCELLLRGQSGAEKRTW